MSFGIEIFGGASGRFGNNNGALEQEEPVDISFGGGLWFAPSRLFSIGAFYQRMGLGAAETPPFVDFSVSVQRDADSVFLGGRVYPLRGDKAGLYLGMLLGLSWQRVSAQGTTPPEVQFVSPTPAFSCTESDGPGFALGGALGVDVDVERNVAFLAQFNAQAHRLSSDPADLNGCAPGAGSVTSLGAQIGFMYRFDLDSEPRRAPASAGVPRRQLLGAARF
jgi:hypothetical protein